MFPVKPFVNESVPADPRVGGDPLATFFAITVALAVIAYGWAWCVILPIIGLLWLAGYL